MNLNITRFFTHVAPMDYSASQAELGHTAGADTWRAALDDADDYGILRSEGAREEFRVYLGSFGAWSREEIAAFTDQELRALLIQMIAADMREYGDQAGVDFPGAQGWDWEEYNSMAECGSISGRLTQNYLGEVGYMIGE